MTIPAVGPFPMPLSSVSASPTLMGVGAAVVTTVGALETGAVVGGGVTGRIVTGALVVTGAFVMPAGIGAFEFVGGLVTGAPVTGVIVCCPACTPP